MLFTQNEMAEKPTDAISSRSDPLGLDPLPVDNRQRFLRFTLSQRNDTLLPLDQILEVIQLPLAEISPIPDVPSCVLGVCSWQGKTLWLVDLNHLVGYLPLCQQSQSLMTPIVIVIQHEGRSLGLAVEQVGDVDLFDEEKIYMETGLCPPSMEPFISGYCPQPGGIVLDASAIINASPLQSHR